MWLSFQIGRVGLNCMVLSGAHMSSSTAYTNMNTCVHRSFFSPFPISLTYTNTKKSMEDMGSRQPCASKIQHNHRPSPGARPAVHGPADLWPSSRVGQLRTNHEERRGTADL